MWKGPQVINMWKYYGEYGDPWWNNIMHICPMSLIDIVKIWGFQQVDWTLVRWNRILLALTMENHG